MFDDPATPEERYQEDYEEDIEEEIFKGHGG